MAKDAVLQVRIDAQLKNDVEQLYREMGTTFSEAVRLFARQSLIRRRLPFDVSETDQVSATHRKTVTTGTDTTDYLSRRQKSFERIAKLPSLPITDEIPSSVAILEQIRAEEAR